MTHDAARNLEPLAEGGDEQGGENVNDYEGRNGGVNGNGNDNGNVGGNDNVNGNRNGGGNGYENHNVNFEGFRSVARECTYQDFLKCQPLNFKGMEGVVSALTWWNTHKRTIGIEAAYAMTWTELIKLMTGGNVITAEPTRLQEAIRIDNKLMDQKLKGYARSAENKRRFDNNPKDNRGQQSAFKRQNVRGQNVARAYTAKNNEKKGRVGHMARDCTAAVTLNTQRAPVVFALKMRRHNLYGMKCVVFTDHKSLQHILDQKELNMRQRRWLELLSDYNCELVLL
ncbi:putative reverse transcriptase domain-containing protein [Tanacetum coccineum]